MWDCFEKLVSVSTIQRTIKNHYLKSDYIKEKGN